MAELKELPIFSGLGEKRPRTMAANLDSVTVKKGEVVMTAGRRNDAFWIILKGHAEICRVHEELGRGDVFGLPSMFAGRESTADVVADGEVAIRFKLAIFDRLRDEVYELARAPEAAR